MTPPPLIDIHNATIQRGETVVFEHLNLRLEQGEHAVILGPNGAGKTTLLKLLGREVYPMPVAGSHVHILGKENWDVWALRRHLGIVSMDLQDQVEPDVPGFEVVLSGFYSALRLFDYMTFSDEQLEQAAQIMDRLGITPLSERPFGALSTGEQRRLFLARALIHHPETLVLDEPTSGLDLKATFQYLESMQGLMAQGIAVVLVTHHIFEIPPGIERVILLKEGKVMADGKRGAVLTSQNLSRLFETPVRLVEADGFLQAVPGF